MGNFTIRKMTCSDLELALEWAAAEGWNPGLYDAELYFALDPNGFLVGELDGEAIASLSVIKYDDQFGFLGFYIVKPGYRGLQHGITLWRAGVEYLSGLNIGLDGVLDQQQNYRTSGFDLAYRNIRFEGRGGGPALREPQVVELKTVPIDRVLAYSSAFFPADRSHFLKRWIDQPRSRALGIVEGGQIAGVGVMRECVSGYKIAPLYADTPEHADALMRALKSVVDASAPVFVDVPEPNSAALELVQRHGMQSCFETARMYTGDFPVTPMERLFGVLSFEVG